MLRFLILTIFAFFLFRTYPGTYSNCVLFAGVPWLLVLINHHCRSARAYKKLIWPLMQMPFMLQIPTKYLEEAFDRVVVGARLSSGMLSYFEYPSP